MKGTNGRSRAEGVAHRPLQLLLGRLSVSGENLFGLAYRYLAQRDTGLGAGQQQHPADLAQDDTRLGIFFKGKDILEDREIRAFIGKHPANFGIDPLQTLGDRLLFGGGNVAVGISTDIQPTAADDADTGVRKARIDAEDFHHSRFMRSGSLLTGPQKVNENRKRIRSTSGLHGVQILFGNGSFIGAGMLGDQFFEHQAGVVGFSDFHKSQSLLQQCRRDFVA